MTNMATNILRIWKSPVSVIRNGEDQDGRREVGVVCRDCRLLALCAVTTDCHCIDCRILSLLRRTPTILTGSFCVKHFGSVYTILSWPRKSVALRTGDLQRLPSIVSCTVAVGFALGRQVSLARSLECPPPLPRLRGPDIHSNQCRAQREAPGRR